MKFISKIFRKKGAYYWMSSPWVVALVITLIYILTTREFFNIYKADYRAMHRKDGVWEGYLDMNSDGKDDKIKFNQVEGKNGYKINCLEKSCNFDYRPILDITPQPGDYNNDKIKELYFLSQHKDSVFLSIWDLKSDDTRNIFIQKLEGYFKYGFMGFADSNGDSYKELYFWGCSNKYFKKRAVIRYDVKNDQLFKTKSLDARFNAGFLNTIGGNNYIVLSTCSFKTKHSEDINYGEKKARIFILDENLNLAVDPIVYDHSNLKLICFNIKENGEDRICVLADSHSRNDEEKDRSIISTYDYSGNKLREKIVEHDLLLSNKGYLAININEDSKILLTLRSGGVMKLSSSLKYEGVYYPGGLEYPIPDFFSDINGNGDAELFFHNRSYDKMVITNENLAYPIRIDLLEPYSKITGCSPIINCNENIRTISLGFYDRVIPENAIVYSKGLIYFIEYGIDEYFWIKYLYALLVFGASFFVVWWVRHFVTKSLEDKYIVDNTIAQLKFQNVSNQMSPHFTLNAMNSIASLIYKEDRETAYDYLCKLARLVRNSLVDANRLERSLKEEIEFVESYLELQKFRFKNRFDYSVQIEDPSVYSCMVMPFIVQTFVENAMKHGLKDVGSGGKILIHIKSLKEGVSIVVEDNGQGRKAAAEQVSTSTGKGIKLVNEYIDILNKKDNRNMSVNIHDLEINDVALGTRVEIFLDKV